MCYANFSPSSLLLLYQALIPSSGILVDFIVSAIMIIVLTGLRVWRHIWRHFFDPPGAQIIAPTYVYKDMTFG